MAFGKNKAATFKFQVYGQSDSSKEASSADTQDKASASGVTSRLGRFSFGSQLFQKTAKFKRWVDEGAAPRAPEAALPPPPKAAVFQNIIMDNSPGMAPLPPSAN
ncbi:hypothetical protein OROMI_005096 [Orobanche minor]